MNSNIPPTFPAQAIGETMQRSSIASDLSTLSNPATPDTARSAVLQYLVNQIIQQNESQGVITSVGITDLQTGRNLVSHNTAASQFAASINKLPIALLLLQDLRTHQVNMSDSLTWSASDVRGGYGVYDQPGAPTTATVQQLIFDMLNASGNTAVRVLVNKTSLGGAQAVNARLAQYPQLVQTRLQIVDPARGAFYLGNTTVDESLWTMERVQRTKDTYEQFMQNAMATNIFTTFGVRSQLAGNSYISLANKVGILDDPAGSGTNRHDVGIIYNAQNHHSYAYSFLTSNYSNGTEMTAQAELSLQQMGLDLLQFAGDRQPQAVGLQPQLRTPAPTAQQQYHEKKILF